jgi:hypothetical protein
MGNNEGKARGTDMLRPFGAKKASSIFKEANYQFFIFEKVEAFAEVL